MKSCNTRLAAFFAAFSMAFGVTPHATAAEVFLVASYHETDPCGKPQFDAAMEALRQGGFGGLTTRGYFLDTRTSPPDAVAAAIAGIKEDLRTVKPRMLITIDDPAFAMLYETALEQRDMQLVFTGLNRRLDYYDDRARFLAGRTPAANITGAFEYLFMREQFDLLEAFLDRRANLVAVLHSTDAVGQILKDQILDELKGTRYERQVILFSASDVPEMIQQARIINEDPRIDAYIPVTMSVLDPADGERKTLEKLAPILISEVKKVDLSLNSSFTEYGFFGGYSVDFYRMGFQAGGMASRLLAGRPIQSMVIEDARFSIIAVNRRRMLELGIRPPPEIRSMVDLWIE